VDDKSLLYKENPPEKFGIDAETGDGPIDPITECSGATEFRPPMLVEVICERYHCVMYDYAITTVDFVAEDFPGRVEVRPVVRRGNRENAERFMELCRLNGRHLSVPTILIDGHVAFTDVPGPAELRRAIEYGLAAWEKAHPERAEKPGEPSRQGSEEK
jgi:hypothetical protein